MYFSVVDVNVFPIGSSYLWIQPFALHIFWQFFFILSLLLLKLLMVLYIQKFAIFMQSKCSAFFLFVISFRTSLPRKYDLLWEELNVHLFCLFFSTYCKDSVLTCMEFILPYCMKNGLLVSSFSKYFVFLEFMLVISFLTALNC